MRVRTLNQAAEEARKQDPNTAINKFMLTSLICDHKIPYGNHGNRTVVDYDKLISALNVLLGFQEDDGLPEIRTIPNAIEELHQRHPDIGLNGKRIRECVADGRIGSIDVGSRRYIAMQSFEQPYCEKIMSGYSKGIVRKEMIKKDIVEQIGDTISNHTVIPKVVRIRTK